MEPVNIAVCTDCVMLLANGEVTDSEGNDIANRVSMAMQREWGNTEITLGSVHDEDCTGDDDCPDVDSFFSSRPCEGCGSTLGGDRHNATAWMEN